MRFTIFLALACLSVVAASAQEVTEIPIGGTIPPVGIAAGPDGNVWLTDEGHRVVRVTPDGGVTVFVAGIDPAATIMGIAMGPDGNMWFVEREGRIGRITPQGVVTEFGTGGVHDGLLWDITAGPDGNLWFTSMEGWIGRMTPSGVVSWFDAAPLRPREIAVGPDGNLWFTLQNSDGIGQMTPSGVLGKFAQGFTASHITAGPDGNLWFTSYADAAIGRMTPSGTVRLFSAGPAESRPFAIAAGSDGNLWFTDIGRGRIGRITPLGVVTDHGASISADGGLWDIAGGPDGNLWFSETGRIGRLTTGVPAATVHAVEYYNRDLDHYFQTWMPDEISKLDAGIELKGWVRTGHAFKAFSFAHGDSSPVCRYYIPPGLGDSHFFGRGTAECSTTGARHPDFVPEAWAFMHSFLPVAGTCPADRVPVYRVFSNRADANHRYTTDEAVRDHMVATGWLAEGDGPDVVVMCAPR